jgi:hypothetical protein
MTPSTDTQVSAPALGLVSDRPPVGRFFIAFCALVALALGLAALSDAGAVTDVDQSQTEAVAQDDSGR